MLLKVEVLNRIVAGEIDRVYRAWKRPTVRPDSTRNTAVGQLAIGAVTPVEPGSLTDADARRAGFDDRAALLRSLRVGDDRTVYAVEVRHAGADPRVALRQDAELSEADLAELRARLARLSWALPALRLIRDHPGRRAPDLAPELGLETRPFKQRIRRLKALGLTESLRVGYRLSPRGQAALAALDG